MLDVYESNHIQIGISSIEDFEQFPPRFFKRQVDGKLTFNRNQVNVFSDCDWLFATQPYPLEYIADTRDDLIDMKRQLLTIPTFLTFNLIDQKPGSCPKTKKFVIFVNPKQTRIRDKLEKSLNRCLSLLDEEVHFSLEIRLDEAIAAFCSKSHSLKQFKVPYNSDFISITNGGQRCQIWYRNPWVFLCPVSFFVAIPYCLCRNCFAEDFSCNLVANVTKIEHHHRHEGDDSHDHNGHHHHVHHHEHVLHDHHEHHQHDLYYHRHHHPHHDSEHNHASTSHEHGHHQHHNGERDHAGTSHEHPSTHDSNA